MTRDNSRSIDWIAKRLTEQDKRLSNLEIKPNLAHSSIDNGSLTVRDSDGNVTAIIGKQEDGTYTSKSVDGPPPPKPSTPGVYASAGTITVSWDGRYANDSKTPMDFAHVEVHMSTEEDFEPQIPTLAGVISSPDGGSKVTSNEYGEWFVRLVAKSESGKASEPSDVVSAVLVPLVAEPDIAGAIDEIYEKIQEDFNKAQASADGKNSIWHSTTAPPTDPLKPHKDGDTWFDPTNGNRINTWQSLPAPGAWVPVVLDGDALDKAVTDAITGAGSTADKALLAANGKNRFIDSTDDKPANTTDYILGDTWRKWSNLGTSGKLMKSWTVKGTPAAWVEDSMDPTYLPKVDIGEGTFGSLKGDRMEVGTILANKLAVMDMTNLVPSIVTQIGDWNLTNGAAVIADAASPDGFRFTIPGGSPRSEVTTVQFVGVIPGEKIKIEYVPAGTLNATNKLEMGWLGASGMGSGVLHTATSTAKVSVVWTVPTNVTQTRFFIRAQTTNGFYAGAHSITARKMTGAVLIEDGAIKAGSAIIEDLAVTDAKIGSLNGGKIVAKTVEGIHLKSKTISVDNLLVGSTDNVIPDPEFTNNSGDWLVGTNVNYSFPLTEGYIGKTALKIAQSTIQAGLYSAPIPTDGAESFRVSVWVKSNVAVPAAALNFYWTRRLPGSTGFVTPTLFLLQSNGVSSGNDAIPANTWTLLSAVLNMPIDSVTKKPILITAIKIGFYKQASFTTGNVWYSEASAFRMADGNLVVDGSILANHIHADAVEAVHIKANAIEADKIQAGAIRATHLAVGGGSEIVSNGSGEMGNNVGFESFTRITTGLPAGFLSGYASSAGQGTTNFQTNLNAVKVKPNTNYRVAAWVKANKAGSVTYLQPMTGGANTTPTYPVSGRAVPTTWTLWDEEFKTADTPGGTMYLRWFINHSAGTATDSVFSFTGFSIQEMTIGSLLVNGAIDGKSITGALIQTDPEPDVGVKLIGDGYTSEDNAKGLHAWGPNGKTLSITGGRGVDYIGISGTLSPGGDTQEVANIDDSGSIMGQELRIANEARLDGAVVMGGDALHPDNYGLVDPGDLGPVILGRSTIGTGFQGFFDNHPTVSTKTSWLDAIPFGVISNGWISSTAAWGWTGLGNQPHYRMIMGVTANLVSGRGYLLNWRCPPLGQTTTLGTLDTANSVGATFVRYSSNGGGISANGAGSALPGTFQYLPGGGGEHAHHGSTYVRCPEDIPAGKIMIGIEAYCYGNKSMASVTSANANRWEIVVSDIGLNRTRNDSANVTSQQQGTASSPPPSTPEPDPVKTYTTTLNQSWHRSYNSSGTQYNGSTSINKKAVFGQSPYYTTGGAKRALLGFSGNPATTLNGATLKKVELYLYTEHWHSSSGGTVGIGYHNETAAPANATVVTYDVKNQAMKKPEGRWITLPNDSKWKGGTIKGILLRAPGNTASGSSYGYVDPGKCKLRFTYTK